MHILEGNFQKSGNKIRVRVQLINGLTDEHFWSDEYTGIWNSADIFKIQAEVAENVARHLYADISEKESLGMKKIPTTNNEAYTNFLLAQSQKYKSNETAFKNAIPYFEKAIALDSNYIEPYVALADIWLIGGLVWGIFDEQEAWDNVKKLLTKAQEIDSGFGDIEDTLYACYFYYDFDFDFIKVDGYYQKRLENFRFNKTPAIDADFAIKTGRLNEAIISMDKHIVKDPSIGNFCSFKAEALMLQGETDDAKSLMKRCDPLYSDDWFYLRESAKLHYYLGNYTQSREQLKKLTTNFSDYPPLLIWLQLVYAQMDGNNAEVKKYLGLLTEEYQKGSSGSPAWFIALYHCSLSNYEETFKWLEISYSQHEVELTWLREEPLLQPLKNDPRYKVLYDKIGFLALDRHLDDK